MKFAQFIVVCFVPLISLAQQTFFKEYQYTDFAAEKSIHCYTASEVDDGFLIAGEKYNTTPLESACFVAKIDQQGNLVSYNLDDTYHLAFYRSSVIKNNFIYITGLKYDIGPAYRKQKFITKYSLTGEKIWSKPFGDTSKYQYDNRVRKILAIDEGFVVFASTMGLNGTTDAEVTFLNDDGEVQYRKLYTTDESLHLADMIYDISIQEDGYVMLIHSPEAMASNSHNSLIKVDTEGNEIWRRTITNYSFPEHDLEGLINKAKGIATYKDNSTVVVFSTEDNPGGNSRQIILAVFDQNGNLVNSTVSLNDANRYLINFVESTANFDIFLSGSKVSDSAANWDLFTAKFDSDLNLLNNQQYGTEGNELTEGTFIPTSDGGTLVGAMRFRYTPVGYNFVLAKTDCMGNVEWDSKSCVISSEEEIVVMGNPMNENLLIQFPQLSDDDYLDFELVNIIGQLVRKQHYSGAIISENVADLSQGIYLYTVKTSNGGIFTGKLMKQ